MRIVIFGDVYGRVGRKALAKEIPHIRATYVPDGIIANIENATSGRGPVSEHAQYFSDLGIDYMTLGDHVFDNLDNLSSYLDAQNTNLIRPANIYSSSNYPMSGNGYIIGEIAGKKILLMQVLGQAFMRHQVANPFETVEEILAEVPAESYDISMLDFHRETTAEMAVMGRMFDGRIGAIYGTHTHVQTGDARVLPDGTGVITDAGMNGPHNSIIGASYESILPRSLTGIQRGKIEQQLTDAYQINAVILDIDTSTNKTTSIEAISYVNSL